MSLAKKITGITVIVLLSLAVIIAAGELYVRIKHGEMLDFKSREAVYKKADFVFHHAFIPGAKGRSVSSEWDVPYSINSYGLRDREYSLEKPAGTFRILAVGDSFTEGYGVRIEDTFVKRLEGKLNASSKSVHYEVINCGMASYSPLLEYIFMRGKGLALDPDMVLLFYDFSDLKDDYEYELTTYFNEFGNPARSLPYKRIRALGSSSLERFLIGHSRFYLYLENGLNKLLFKFFGTARTPEEDITVDRYVAFREGQELLARNLCKRNLRYIDMIYRMLKVRGIEFVLVSYPYAVEVASYEWSNGREKAGFEKGRVYPQPEVVRQLEEYSRGMNIPFINLYGAFRNRGEVPFYYPFDGHWNESGHELVADSLAKKLKYDGLI